MGWQEEEIKRKLTEKETADREYMAIANPMENLWEKICKANDMLPKLIRLKCDQGRSPNTLEKDGKTYINNSIGGKERREIYIRTEQSASSIRYNPKSRNYYLLGWINGHRYHDYWFFSPEEDIEKVLKSCVLELDILQQGLCKIPAHCLQDFIGSWEIPNPPKQQSFLERLFGI